MTSTAVRLAPVRSSADLAIDFAVTAQLPAEPLAADALATAIPQAPLAAQIVTLTVERDAANAAKATAIEEAASLTQQLAAAQALLAELQSPSAVIGGVPQRVSPYQARVALKRAGLLGAVEAAVTAADGEAEIAWHYATTFERRSPFIVQLGAGLGLSDATIDALFVEAAKV